MINLERVDMPRQKMSVRTRIDLVLPRMMTLRHCRVNYCIFELLPEMGGANMVYYACL